MRWFWVVALGLGAVSAVSLLQKRIGSKRVEAPRGEAPRARAVSAMPKIELHAHLSGSIRRGTLVELAARESDAEALRAGGLLRDGGLLRGRRSLRECFDIFGLIHRHVRSLDDVARITREALEDASADRTSYIELRSTPRRFDGETPTDEMDYVRAVVGAMAAWSRRGPACKVVPRLLVSVDRSRSVEAAEKMVDDLCALRAADETVREFVVGLDFSGNPTAATFCDYAHIFRKARDVFGLPAALHVAEVPRNDGDADAILDFALERPEACRLGHALYLSEAQLLRAQSLCIEVCPSSNVATLDLASLAQHPLLRRGEGRLVLCTDDSAVFGSGLGDEYAKVLCHFSDFDLEQMLDTAAQCSFDADAAKLALAAASDQVFQEGPTIMFES
ncbi:hypothetical protein M885DRAFT_521499 [Pelagophyceae sp. CCMP2097]|nr:hypothetical protein M885DRAFT_521499 [Pelagophyceae sp. CCMP2097]|mmetsp:Transcript_22611/g.77508  ORF Transcript_22611/g.77508 Transcript_22611/m.77508 type:complete len:391 (+) Transcript_22611:84-1256(+)